MFRFETQKYFFLLQTTPTVYGGVFTQVLSWPEIFPIKQFLVNLTQF